MANNDQNDKELNDYLNGDSDVSKAYRASNKQKPSSKIDDAIFSAAKEAVDSNLLKEKPKFHKSPWVKPVSIAAMITLSVSLVVTIQQESGKPLISEPDIEMFDSATVIEESAITETIISSDDASAPAPAVLGAAEDMYRAEEKTEAAKARMKAVPAKKILSKEKAQLEVLKESAFADEQILPSAPTGVEFDGAVSMKQDYELSMKEETLLKIKGLWEQGEIFKAKETYENFTKDYPDVSSESIKEILGDYIYNGLLNN